MPPQHFIVHASFGNQDKVAANNMEQDFSSSSFAFSSSLNDLMQDELDFLSNISTSSSPKPVISNTHVNERIQRLRQEKLAKQEGKPQKKSRLEMNISSHRDPALPSNKNSNGRKGQLKENKLLQQPIIESKGRLSDGSQELKLDESINVSSHFRDKVAEHSAELRKRKKMLLASLDLAPVISGSSSKRFQRSSSQPSLSRTGGKKDGRSKRGFSMDQISLNQYCHLTEKLKRKKQVLASLDSASMISGSSSIGYQRSSSQPSLSRTGRRKDERSKRRSSMDQTSLSSAESIDEKESKQEEMQREKEEKHKGKFARTEREASPSPKKYHRSSSDQGIKTEKISLKKKKGKGKDRSPFREDQRPSLSSKEYRGSAHSADKISSPGRSGRRSSSSHNKQSSPKPDGQADGSNHDRSSIGRLSSSSHDRLTTPTGRRRSSSNHARLSSSSHDRLTTRTGRRRTSSNHNRLASEKISLEKKKDEGKDRSPSREDQRPSLSSKEYRGSAHSADKIRLPSRSGRRSSSSHNKQISPKSNIQSSGSNHGQSPIGVLSSSSHDRLTTPTGRRRSSSNHDRLSSSSHDRLTTPSGRRRSSVKDGGSLLSKSKKDDWKQLLHSFVESETLLSHSSNDNGHIMTSPNTEQRNMQGSSPHSPHAPKDRRPMRVSSLAAPLSAPAAARRPVGIRRKSQVMNLLPILDDNLSRETDLDTPSRHYRRSGSLKSRRAQASATRKNSIEYSMSKIINGGTMDPPPTAK